MQMCICTGIFVDIHKPRSMRMSRHLYDLEHLMQKCHSIVICYFRDS